jgi:hypothetical protein
MGVALRTARRHVNQFTDECEIMTASRDADECRDCEAVLQLGIDAFNWLIRADEFIRSALYEGMDYDPEADEAIRELFKAWLRPCVPANKWIDTQQKRGYHVENLEKFRKCEREARSIVKSMEADGMTDAMRKLRDDALTEHRNGETAEFV